MTKSDKVKLVKVPVNRDPHAWRTIRDKNCTDCKLHKTADVVCDTGMGSLDFSKIWVVGKMPNSGNYQQLIEDALVSVGLDPRRIYYTSALKCRTFEQNASNLDVKMCRQYMDKEIEAGEPWWILALGNEALLSLTGHSGVMKWRSKVIEVKNRKVVATLAPAAVTRNPGQMASWKADLSFFAAQVKGKTAKVKPPGVLIVDSQAKFDKLKEIIRQTEVLSYDIETNGFDEFKVESRIVSLAGTSQLRNGKVIVWALPLFHPQSPFRSSWVRVLSIIAPLLEAIPKQVAHNGKFDARWLRQFNVWVKVTFDTMLACHLLDENRLKGLKPQATARFGVGDWSISTKNLVDQPLKEVLIYNALDTFYAYNIYLETKQELVEQPRLLRIFTKLTMPANEMLIECERRGIWIDRRKLATNTKIANDTRGEIDRKIMEHVPQVASFEEGREIGWPAQGKRAKLAEVNFNPSNFARWFLFDHLGLPVLATGKEKPDGSIGDPSMAEDVMKALKGTHPVIDLFLERTKWQKYCSSFLSTYSEIADENDRLHTTFKLAGTVTGRLSSGKVDADKVTARADIRGVNIQQVPRDPFIRGMFGAGPGYDFVEADFSQVELRVVAFISRDPVMMHLYQTGQDIHLATASNVLGVPMSQVSKDDRKKAKAVNFGFVYGMGWRKFILTALEKYDLIFTELEAQEVRKLFFQQFRGLFPWHARQRRLVAEHGRVMSPLGRIRHLPDIYSGDPMVRGEAERQAINSPVQGFASDMTMLSMLLINDEFKAQGIKGHVIGTVHDALLFEIKRKHTARALPIIKNTMENLPLERKFGVHLDVPIISDLKVGTHWGSARELTPEEVYDYHAD